MPPSPVEGDILMSPLTGLGFNYDAGAINSSPLRGFKCCLLATAYRLLPAAHLLPTNYVGRETHAGVVADDVAEDERDVPEHRGIPRV